MRDHISLPTWPLIVMLLTPLMFSSNLIFGRGLVGVVPPFTLACIRWLSVSLLLSPLIWAERHQIKALFQSNARLMLLMGFLGMWICGGLVYLSLNYTTATNGTLIYTTSPVFIMLIEWLVLGRVIIARQWFGAFVAFMGVAVIVTRGDWHIFTTMRFNIGDLMILVAAISWAIYSVLGRKPQFMVISTFANLGLIAFFGAITLIPLALWEWQQATTPLITQAALPGLVGIVFISSILAFGGFQYGVRKLGTVTAGFCMYLLPPYGVGLAVLLLGEQLYSFHIAGIILVMTGIVLATWPKKSI